MNLKIYTKRLVLKLLTRSVLTHLSYSFVKGKGKDTICVIVDARHQVRIENIFEILVFRVSIIRAFIRRGKYIKNQNEEKMFRSDDIYTTLVINKFC